MIRQFLPLLVQLVPFFPLAANFLAPFHFDRALPRSSSPFNGRRVKVTQCKIDSATRGQLVCAPLCDFPLACLRRNSALNHLGVYLRGKTTSFRWLRRNIKIPDRDTGRTRGETLAKQPGEE